MLAFAAMVAFSQTPQEFHIRAQERTGLLIPMYVYPTSPVTNAAYNRLIDVKRRYETVPMWVIVNVASGPGTAPDPNYVTVINRLVGAGCVVLGYVPTNYAKRTLQAVEGDVNTWLRLYPRVHGVFFDEMFNGDSESGVAYQAALTSFSHEKMVWPVVSNPGTTIPDRYFATNAADVFVTHEDGKWPVESSFGPTATNFPAFSRGVLVYGQSSLNTTQLKMVRKYAKWIYVTDDVYRPGDPKAPNPWDTLSKHVEDMCKQIIAN